MRQNPLVLLARAQTVAEASARMAAVSVFATIDELMFDGFLEDSDGYRVPDGLKPLVDQAIESVAGG